MENDMFGSLKPTLKHVSSESKQLYHAAYCNLCAALSASGSGAFNRFFLINDVVTLDWLFIENTQSEDHVFSCHNCVKGGVLCRTNKITSHQKLLAALSTFVCGVKIKDNAIDNPKLINKFLALLYRPLMRKSEAILQEFKLLDKVNALINLNNQNEVLQLSDLSKAAAPTENSYSMMAVEIARTHSTLPTSTIKLLGQYLGRCVYFLDAIEDMDEDRKKNQYNVLNLLMKEKELAQQKNGAIETCLEFIKPMRLEITQKLESLSKNLSTQSLQKKWESLFISIENQFLNFIKPLPNNQNLLSILFSFSSGSIQCFRLPINIEETLPCASPNCCGTCNSCVNACPCCSCLSCCPCLSFCPCCSQ
jgi:hypothetical protein